MKRSTTAVAVSIGSGAVAAVLLVVSNDPVLLSGGSDSLSTVFAPPLAGQIVAAMLVTALAGAAVVRRGATGAFCAVAVVALLALATHRVVIDPASMNVRESWALITVQRLVLPDDAEASVEFSQSGWMLRFTASSGAMMTVLRGPPGLALAAQP